MSSASIDKKIAPLGPAKMTGSAPVTIATDQISVPTYTTSKDGYFIAQVSPIGELATTNSTNLVGNPFSDSTLDTNFWITTGQSGTGATSTANGVATLTTGSTANSVAVLSTAQVARFSFANPHKFRAIVRTADAGTTNNVRRIGAGDGTNNDFGFVISGSGNSNFGIFTRTAGGSIVDVLYGFNGVLGTTITWDTNPHVLEVYYFSAGLFFYLDGLLLHRILPVLGTTIFSAPIIAILSQPIRFSNTNSGGSTTVVTIDVWNAAIIRYGDEPVQTPIYNHITGAVTGTVLKRGPGYLHRVTINTPGTLATLYDNVTGTTPVIAVLTTTGAVTTIDFGVTFQNGLMITTTGAGTDLTLIYS